MNTRQHVWFFLYVQENMSTTIIELLTGHIGIPQLFNYSQNSQKNHFTFNIINQTNFPCMTAKTNYLTNQISMTFRKNPVVISPLEYPHDLPTPNTSTTIRISSENTEIFNEVFHVVCDDGASSTHVKEIQRVKFGKVRSYFRHIAVLTTTMQLRVSSSSWSLMPVMGFPNVSSFLFVHVLTRYKFVCDFCLFKMSKQVLQFTYAIVVVSGKCSGAI